MDVVLGGCKPEGLAALALTSCDFIDDLTGISVTRQLPSSSEKPDSEKAVSSTAAEKPKPSETAMQSVAAAEQTNTSSSNGVVVESSSSGLVEDKVCIAGAACLKVHFDNT